MSHTPDGPGDPPAPLTPPDPSDPDYRERLTRWLLDLRVALDDIDSVVNDMLRPVRERELGHAQHVTLYDDARQQAVQMLDWMMGSRRRMH